VKTALLCALSGVLVALSFPGFPLPQLAWIALIPYLVCLYRSENFRQSLLCGFVFGSVYFGGAFFWLSSTSKWAGPAGYLAWIGLSLYQSIFIVLFSYFAWLLIRAFNRQLHPLVLPLLWAFFEWLRQAGEFGSPGGYLGSTQYLNTVFIQTAQFSGVWGVSALIVAVNTAAALLLLEKGNLFKKLLSNLPSVCFVLGLLAASYSYGIDSINKYGGVRSIGGTSIAVIQPAIAQEQKLDSFKLYWMIDELELLTQKTLSYRPKIVIWPETAVMTYLIDDKAAFAKVRDICVKGGFFLVTGAFYRESGRIYNSIFVVSPQGKIVSRYDKHHLMPFGEYLPFKKVLYPLLKHTGYFEQDQSPGQGTVHITAAGRKFGAMICFESLFEGMGRQRSGGSDALLTITNDAWFGRTHAAEQHISAGVFRAVENRKYFIQAANTGISALIDPCGRFVKRMELDISGPMVFTLP